AKGQSVLRLERGRPAGLAPGPFVAQLRAECLTAARRDGRGTGGGNAVLDRGQRSAYGAGATRRLDQAELTRWWSTPTARHCHNSGFKLANNCQGACAVFGRRPLIITRRAVNAALALGGLAAFVGLSPL